jgi:ABC-type transport system involved in cytochrome c biogenesis permease subunit
MAADVTALRETTLAEERSVNPLSAVGSALLSVLRSLSSLKLTVVLFAMSIFLVLLSTLAQTENDIWVIIHNWYRIDERKLFSGTFPWFHVSELFVWVRFQYFFPHAFFPDIGPVAGGFWFPRGWLIGMLMGINLLAAHLVRFKVQASGWKLVGGTCVIALGCLATRIAIESGASAEGILGGAVISWDLFRTLLTMSLCVLAIGLTGVGLFLPSRRMVERIAAFTVAGISLAVLGYVLWYGRAGHIEDSSARILWQLLKGTGAGLLLLAGCRLVFHKRAGIVLLHGGVGLMFAYEVIVGTSHQEAQMSIIEGQTANFVQDIRSPEFVVLEKAFGDKKQDTAVTVPADKLKPGATIDLPAPAPFNVRIVQFFQNSNLDIPDPETGRPAEGKPIPNLATAGRMAPMDIKELPPGTGTDADSKVDMPSMYVDLLNKQDGRSLGVYLVSWALYMRDVPPQTVDVDGRPYAIDFRPKRTYKPYDLTLREVRKDDYLAGDKVRNYSSLLRVVDSTRGIDREESIRMNNPMRFADATFYQSGYHVLSDGRKATVIQVVDNVGWMLPYVSCMIVMVGCVAQFGTTLLRFLNRRQAADIEAAGFAPAPETGEPITGGGGRPSRARAAAAAKIASSRKPPQKPVMPPPLPDRTPAWLRYGVPGGAVALILLLAAAMLMPARAKEGEMNFYEFGRLPVAYESRVKPFDSMARTTLVALSQRQTFKEKLDDSKEASKPATRWLLDMMTDPEKADTYQVFRIDNVDVVKTLGLKRNKHNRYSLVEIGEHADAMIGAAKQARDKGKRVNSFDREILKLDARISNYRMIQLAFTAPDFEKVTPEDFKADAKAAAATWLQSKKAIDAAKAAVRKMRDRGMKPPLPIPEGSEGWEMYTAAHLADVAARNYNEGVVNPAMEKFHAILNAYSRGDVAAFNTAVADYRSYLDANPPHDYDRARRDQETYMNRVEPFFWCSFLYLFGFVVSAIGWLGWSKVFNRIAFAIITTTFVLHVAAIAWRIYITERPPVINLYSSAVFIAAGVAMFGIIFEAVYKLGVGNVVAGLAGFGSLQIAHLLSLQEDTIQVLEAVLDTQFWLTTHVVCVTLGYAVTYAAGLLGAIYIVWGLLTPNFTGEISKELSRMIYGMLCFALLFSFFGTVLGGLWADDSWGRFWGWDPKENGALIIVLWNALVLHARWGGMVKERGLAILAVAGNITTSWSWFGVNQLGVGLHAYGFSKELMDVLFYFVAGSMVLVAAGSIPRRLWRSAPSLGTPA